MRQKDLQIVPFVYVPCKILPGIIAIPMSELEEEKLKEEKEKNNVKKCGSRRPSRKRRS
jgi:hypothetical protein